MNLLRGYGVTDIWAWQWSSMNCALLLMVSRYDGVDVDRVAHTGGTEWFAEEEVNPLTIGCRITHTDRADIALERSFFLTGKFLSCFQMFPVVGHGVEQAYNCSHDRRNRPWNVCEQRCFLKFLNFFNGGTSSEDRESRFRVFIEQRSFQTLCTAFAYSED